MIGTILNAAGILAGAAVGLISRRQPSATTQQMMKTGLAILMVFAGLRLTVISLKGGVGTVLGQLALAVVAMVVGQVIGRGLRLQKGMNRLGRYAQERFSRAAGGQPARFEAGFLTCTILFCAAPLSILGAVQDGLAGRWGVLGIKALLDGLAIYGFMMVFGGWAVFSVIPMVAFQGSVTLAVRALSPWLSQHGLVDSINAVGGLLVFCVALLVLEVRRVEVANYLPSLAVAPLLSWLVP